MRRNCNLELRLVPPSASLHSAADHHHLQPMLDLSNGSEREAEQQQNLTIFYQGRVSVCDVTELQARAIIMLASRETDEGKSRSTPTLEPSSPLIQSQLCSPRPCPAPTSDLSMKRSLQRFLQKRKRRIQANSPYNQ